ncbi:unnamed protein product, partial [Cladocopium goreaui]
EPGAEFWRCVPLGNGMRCRADCRMKAKALARFQRTVEAAGHRLKFLDDDDEAKEMEGRKRLRDTAEKVGQAAELARSLLALYPAGGKLARRRRQMERVTELAVL